MPPLQGKFILRFVVYWNFTRILYGAVQCKRLVVYINHLPETIIKDFRQPVTYLIPSILISAAMMALYVAIYQCWIEERYPRRKAAAWAGADADNTVLCADRLPVLLHGWAVTVYHTARILPVGRCSHKYYRDVCRLADAESVGKGSG